MIKVNLNFLEKIQKTWVHMEFITTLARPLISFLKETNSWLNDLYNTWYLISKSNFQKGHPVPKNIKLTIDLVGIRLFYANFDQGYKDIDQIIAPREEKNLYIKNFNNPYNRNYFSERIRNFKKYFQVKKKFFNIALNKILWIICENKKKKIKSYSKKQKINYWRKVKFCPKPTYCTTSPTC